MKKIITLLICFQLFAMPAIAIAPVKDDFEPSIKYNKQDEKFKFKYSNIKDDFTESPSNENNQQKPQKIYTPIKNDFEPSAKYEKQDEKFKFEYSNIKDNFDAKPLTENNQNSFKSSAAYFLKKDKKQEVFVSDDQVKKYLESKKNEKPDINLNYDYTSIEQHPIEIKITKYLTTRHNNSEGKFIDFYIKEPITLKDGRVIPANTRVKGRIETVSQNQIGGVPADLVIGNFKVQGYPDLKIESIIEKTGANRTFWVSPLCESGIVFFIVGAFVTYPLFMQIRGGHAKLHKWQTYTVYYK